MSLSILALSLSLNPRSQVTKFTIYFSETSDFLLLRVTLSLPTISYIPALQAYSQCCIKVRPGIKNHNIRKPGLLRVLYPGAPRLHTVHSFAPRRLQMLYEGVLYPNKLQSCRLQLFVHEAKCVLYLDAFYKYFKKIGSTTVKRVRLNRVRQNISHVLLLHHALWTFRM